MKKILLILVVSLLSLSEGFASFVRPYKEGDIIFIISNSRQSKYIMWATCSVWTHCGIVVEKNGECYVLEASNVVKLTPLEKFDGLFTLAVSCRYTENPIKINYKKYLGRPYDSQFRWNNNRYYCSELVWKIYKEQLGVELCKPRPLSSYNTLFLGNIMKRRGISKNDLFVSPADLMMSSKLYGV